VCIDVCLYSQNNDKHVELSDHKARRTKGKQNYKKMSKKNIFKSATAFCDDSFLTTERTTYYSFLVTIKKNKNSRITCR
jgi:hypothetical protein